MNPAAPWPQRLKSRLEVHARRPVTVWCRPCTTLQSCGEKQQVEEKRMETTCIGNCQNGQGTLFWANGDVYEGQWKNHRRNGQGAMSYAMPAASCTKVNTRTTSEMARGPCSGPTGASTKVNTRTARRTARAP